METVQMGHAESVMPFCVRNYKLMNENNQLLYEKEGNYQSVNTIEFHEPVSIRELKVVLEHPSSTVPASLFHIIVR